MESIRLLARRRHVFDTLFMCCSEELVDDGIVQNKQVEQVFETFDHSFVTVGVTNFRLKSAEVEVLVSRVFDMLVVN